MPESITLPMIHQLIFASPKPGMSEADFQRYWVEEHAVRYAQRIPQIRRYLVDKRIPFSGDPPQPLFGGAAEIWLRDEREELQSLQSKEFLEGARTDEPRWAAFWLTLALDTTAYLLTGPEMPDPHMSGVKLMTLARRREGTSRDLFRRYSLGPHADIVARLPGLRRSVQCHTCDGAYVVGEARFDCVMQWWFDDLTALERALESDVYRKQVCPDLDLFAEHRYLFSFAMVENWIIRPGERQ